MQGRDIVSNIPIRVKARSEQGHYSSLRRISCKQNLPTRITSIPTAKEVSKFEAVHSAFLGSWS